MNGGRTSPALCLAWIVISFHVLGAAPSCKEKLQKPPAIFVFGDGMLDVGNNNFLNSTEEFGDPLRANHSYYGIDFPKSEATGRFSNGYNIADFIAKALGFGISPPAYLSLPGSISMVDFTAVNYASQGARIWDYFYADDSTQVTIPLLEQVDKFVATKAQIAPQLDRNELKKLLSNSIFLLSFGATDLIHVWYLQNLMFKHNQSSVQYLLSYGVGVKALFDAGARKFAVINAPPIGCAPASQVPWRRHGFVRGSCDESKNKLAMEFNDGLRHLLASLSSELHGFRYSVADFYGFANATFANPSVTGTFVNTNTQCCGNPCMPGVNGGPCENRTQYWFCDGSYLTEKAAKLAAAAFYHGPAQFTVPVSFKKLAQRK